MNRILIGNKERPPSISIPAKMPKRDPFFAQRNETREHLEKPTLPPIREKSPRRKTGSFTNPPLGMPIRQADLDNMHIADQITALNESPLEKNEVSASNMINFILSDHWSELLVEHKTDSYSVTSVEKALFNQQDNIESPIGITVSKTKEGNLATINFVQELDANKQAQFIQFNLDNSYQVLGVGQQVKFFIR